MMFEKKPTSSLGYLFYSLFYPIILCYTFGTSGIAFLATGITFAAHFIRPGMELFFLQILIPTVLVCGMLKQRVYSYIFISQRWISFIVPFSVFFILFTYEPKYENALGAIALVIYVINALIKVKELKMMTEHEFKKTNKPKTEKETDTYKDYYSNSYRRNNTSKQQNTKEQQDYATQTSANAGKDFFTGLTAEETKKKYKILMKKYHPDNVSTGDPAMAKKIIEEYRAYKKMMGV